MNDSDAAAAELGDALDFGLSASNFAKEEDSRIDTATGYVDPLIDCFEPKLKANGDSNDESVPFFPLKPVELASFGDHHDNPAIADAPGPETRDVADQIPSNENFVLSGNDEMSSGTPNPPIDLKNGEDEEVDDTPETLPKEVTEGNNLDTSEVEIVGENKGSGLTPDDYYYQQLNPDELSYFNDHKAALDMRCLVCSKQVTSYNSLFRHPSLSISTCSKCCNFLLRDGWTKDEAGCDQECRWCGQGGNILLCDNCPSSFCENCLFKNLGRKYLKEAKTLENWKCLMCDSSPILKLRADHYEIYKLQSAGRSKKRLSEKQPEVVEPEEKFDEEVVRKYLEGAFKTDMEETLEKIKRAVQEEKDYCYENIATLDIEALKTSTKNLRKILSNFEGFFNSERSRVGRLFNRSFPNHKIFLSHDSKVQNAEGEEKVKTKVPKSKPAKKKVRVNKPARKTSMPVVVLKSAKKKKTTTKKPPPAPKVSAVKKRQPPAEKAEVSRVRPRKRPASPEAAVIREKVARTSKGNRSSSPQPIKQTPTPARGRRSGTTGKTPSIVDSSPSSSRSPSPPLKPVQSKPFVTPATKKAFPDTQSSRPSPIIPSLTGILSNFASNDDSATKPKPKIGPKSRVQKPQPETDCSNETPPKKRIGPKSRIGRDN